MRSDLVRAYFFELLGTFTLVFFSAGIVFVHYLNLPIDRAAESTYLIGFQPGLVGIALCRGLILALALMITVPLSGGCLNPAITLALALFGKLDIVRATWLMGAQFVGAVLAGLCLRFTFASEVLEQARFATPHLTTYLGYPDFQTSHVFTALGLELLLTFFLALAMFVGGWPMVGESGRAKDPKPMINDLHIADSRQLALYAGLLNTCAAFLAFSMTGAALNPAYWFGTVFWEWAILREPLPGPFRDGLAFTLGPLIGALLAGCVFFWFGTQPTAPKNEKSRTAK